MLPRSPQPLGTDEREDLDSYFFVVNPEGKYLGCRKGVWVPAGISDTDLPEFSLTRIHKDRAESCFFVEYQVGMSFEAAHELHFNTRIATFRRDIEISKV